MKSFMSDPFVEIPDEDTGILQKVLQQRLPRSAKEYNMLVNKRRFRKDVQVYTLDGDMSGRAVILMIICRKDFGQDINMSVPLDFVPTAYMREALITTKVIDWDGPYFFTSLDRAVTPLVVDVSTSVKKNSILYNPNYQYMFDVNEALHQDFRELSEGVEIRPLDKSSGAKFLIDNWKYAKDGTMEYVQSVLDKNPSAGVYVNGELACGGIVNVHGLIGLLYTDPHFRRGGYGQLCMRYLLKEMAVTGQVPCSSAQSKNIKSCQFHEKLGMVVTHETDYIFHTPYNESKVHK